MEIINRIRPAIYHLLDGTINEDAGYSSSGIFDYVINQLNNKDYITFLYYSSDRNLEIRRNMKDYMGSRLFIDHNFKSDISQLNSKFNLIQIGSDNHATSILLHKMNDILYLSTFNSGLNLEIHNKYDDKYSAFICYKIDSEFEKHIFFILSISNFYNNIKNYNIKKKDPKILYEIVIWIQYYNNNNSSLPNIYFEINNIEIDTPTFLNDIIKYIDYETSRCDLPESIQIKVTITDPYYYFFHTILKKIINTDPIEYKFNNDQIRLVNNVKNEHSINDIIFDKMQQQLNFSIDHIKNLIPTVSLYFDFDKFIKETELISNIELACKLSDDIYFLPNIFIEDYNKINNNNNNLLFVLYELPENNYKILIIPKYMIIYFEDKIVFNIKLKIIKNNILISNEKIKEILEQINNFILFKIINNTIEETDIHNIDIITIYIACTIMLYDNNIKYIYKYIGKLLNYNSNFQYFTSLFLNKYILKDNKFLLNKTFNIDINYISDISLTEEQNEDLTNHIVALNKNFNSIIYSIKELYKIYLNSEDLNIKEFSFKKTDYGLGFNGMMINKYLKNITFYIKEYNYILQYINSILKESNILIVEPKQLSTSEESELYNKIISKDIFNKENIYLTLIDLNNIEEIIKSNPYLQLKNKFNKVKKYFIINNLKIKEWLGNKYIFNNYKSDEEIAIDILNLIKTDDKLKLKYIKYKIKYITLKSLNYGL